MGLNVNMKPTRHVVGGAPPRKPRPASGSCCARPIQLKEERVAPRSSAKPKNMFNPSMELDAQVQAANVARVDAPIPEPQWHIPGLDDPPRNNIRAKMEKSTFTPEQVAAQKTGADERHVAWQTERTERDAAALLEAQRLSAEDETNRANKHVATQIRKVRAKEKFDANNAREAAATTARQAAAQREHVEKVAAMRGAASNKRRAAARGADAGDALNAWRDVASTRAGARAHAAREEAAKGAAAGSGTAAARAAAGASGIPLTPARTSAHAAAADVHKEKTPAASPSESTGSARPDVETNQARMLEKFPWTNEEVARLVRKGFWLDRGNRFHRVNHQGFVKSADVLHHLEFSDDDEDGAPSSTAQRRPGAPR